MNANTLNPLILGLYSYKQMSLYISPEPVERTLVAAGAPIIGHKAFHSCTLKIIN